MKMNYTYPVLLERNQEGFTEISFPAFPDLATAVEPWENPIPIAQSCLARAIKDLEDRDQLPPPDGCQVETKPGQTLVYVNLWMPYYRSKIKEVYVKKTLTIPLWLDILAKEGDINFSATLSRALKEELHLVVDLTDTEKEELYKGTEA